MEGQQVDPVSIQRRQHGLGSTARACVPPVYPQTDVGVLLVSPRDARRMKPALMRIPGSCEGGEGIALHGGFKSHRLRNNSLANFSHRNGFIDVDCATNSDHGATLREFDCRIEVVGRYNGVARNAE